MITINYCPSCGCELNKGSFVCPKCGLDFKDIVDNKHVLVSNDANNTIDYFEGESEYRSGEEIPIFEVGEDDSNIEIVLDDGDLIGPDGLPREIPIEIFVEDADEDIQFEIVSDENNDDNITIESDGEGNFVIKPKIEFPCPVCGAMVGEDLVCKSCFSQFSLTPDSDDDGER